MPAADEVLDVVRHVATPDEFCVLLLCGEHMRLGARSPPAPTVLDGRVLRRALEERERTAVRGFVCRFANKFLRAFTQMSLLLPCRQMRLSNHILAHQ
jgi:hypothetical protein